MYALKQEMNLSAGINAKNTTGGSVHSFIAQEFYNIRALYNYYLFYHEYVFLANQGSKALATSSVE